MAQTTNTARTTIQDLEDRRYEAVLHQDYETLEGLYHPDLVYGHTGGNRDSLQKYLAKLRTGALRYHRIDHPVEDIILLGDTAIVIGQMNADLTVGGTSKTMHNSCLAVWTKDTGAWKFVAYQPTPRAHA